MELSHEMSQIDACDCAVFVSQHCSANIKASDKAQVEKSRGFSRNQVVAPARKVEESRDKSFQALDQGVFD